MSNAAMLAIVIAVVTPLVTAAVAFGAVKASSRFMSDRMDRFERSIEKFGERLGGVESEMKVYRALDQAKRRLTGEVDIERQRP